MKIEPVFQAEIPKIIKFLQSTPDWGHKSFDWMFNHPWLVDNEHQFGMMLKDNNDNVVGFLGTIFSKRQVNSSSKVYCSLDTDDIINIKSVQDIIMVLAKY